MLQPALDLVVEYLGLSHFCVGFKKVSVHRKHDVSHVREADAVGVFF